MPKQCRPIRTASFFYQKGSSSKIRRRQAKQKRRHSNSLATCTIFLKLPKKPSLNPMPRPAKSIAHGYMWKNKSTAFHHPFYTLSYI
ncbi:hypothetical protein CA264_14940 [Pontibacter actiniarum]|uniref:Uncharacterized protein n=1 Tax=Pontibacter actiniarum TaxID=323450 RepID=A0A1X9YUR3_9BACT|nr:hypothetical protein CA264_14940 [Pontibacter actiniarum]